VLLEKIIALAEKAGAAILEVYSSEDFSTTSKEDGSPLTRADMAADALIIEGLGVITPDMPIISEESKVVPFEKRRGWGRFWLVDPLDGTKEFVKRNGEFTVNIALIEDGCPVLGVVHAPVFAVTYFAALGEGAFKTAKGSAKEAIGVAGYESGPPKLVASRSHRGAALEAFISKLGSAEFVHMGSSLKLCLVAEGAAHLYPRFGPTMEWDTAAAHAVVKEAGGRVTDLTGTELRYNKEDLHNPHFMAAGVPAFPWMKFLD
jgi:3'(2'), 5'-bisphosphate nucleotidase